MTDAPVIGLIAEDPLADAIRGAVDQPAVLAGLLVGDVDPLLKHLGASLGGAPVYVSKRGGRQAMLERNRRLRECFDGRNYDELARAANLTPRQVRNILRQDKK